MTLHQDTFLLQQLGQQTNYWLTELHLIWLKLAYFEMQHWQVLTSLMVEAGNVRVVVVVFRSGSQGRLQGGGVGAGETKKLHLMSHCRHQNDFTRMWKLNLLFH